MFAYTGGLQGEQGIQGEQGEQGEAGASGVNPWVDRGDNAAFDYTEGDLTDDSTWHDLDISGIVGVGERLVLLRFTVRAANDGKKLQLRTKGYSNEINVGCIYSQYGGDYKAIDVWIPTEATGKIQYNITTNGFNSIDATVRGWFVL